MYADYSLSVSYIVATYNVGQKFDYKQLLIRNGQHSNDLNIQKLYKAIVPAYEKSLEAFNRDTKPNKPYWEHPSFQVTPEDLIAFDKVRIEKLKSVYEIMRETCAIVLLQEVESVSEVNLVKQVFSKNFNWSYDVTNNYQNKQVADALIGWNKNIFIKVSDTNTYDSLGNIKSTSVILRAIKTHEIIHAASLHAPGFAIKNPTKQNTLAGDKAVLSVIDCFKASLEKYPPHVAFIGGDFNSQFNPKHYSSEEECALSQNRFKILEDEGFWHVPQDKPTAYNKDIAAMNDGIGSCDLDHLFVNGLAKRNVRELSHFSSNYPLEDPAKNGSDHRPLFFALDLLLDYNLFRNY